MNGNQLIAADTAAVVTAGRNTADTAQAWGLWATRCAYAFIEAGEAMSNARIELAASFYAPRVVGDARQVGLLVEALGADTASAGTIIDNADAEAATMLSRPLNGGKVMV